jgi:DNA processing protein
MDRLAAYIGFNMTYGVGPARLRRLISHFGSPERAWRAGAHELQRAGLDARTIEALLEARRDLDLSAELRRIQASGVSVCTWEDTAYPQALREIYDPPPLLYMRGSLMPSDQRAVAIVGTRNPTAYGQEVTYRLARALAHHGVTVISGLALGIDTIAHTAALEAGGRTIAVLGGGLQRIYPEKNKPLAQRITQQGVLISEYAPYLPALAGNFPARNRVISGLSLGVLVVEAGERSGALITAQFALEHGRDVFAIPGSILSRASSGSNRLISEGATLVQRVEDILEQLNMHQQVVQQEMRMVIPETPEEARLLDILSFEPQHIDELGRLCQLHAGALAAMLSLMELKGYVRCVNGMYYVRAR